MFLVVDILLLFWSVDDEGTNPSTTDIPAKLQRAIVFTTFMMYIIDLSVPFFYIFNSKLIQQILAMQMVNLPTLIKDTAPVVKGVSYRPRKLCAKNNCLQSVPTYRQPMIIQYNKIDRSWKAISCVVSIIYSIIIHKLTSLAIEL